MQPYALMTFAILAAVPLAGCMDAGTDGNEAYTPRTYEFDLVVNPTSNINLYTLNDGVTQMRVAAVGFTTLEDPTLSVPNPEIRMKEGDTLILTITNNNPMAHTFHLHGGLVPWEMDGVPFMNQIPIKSGESFTYTFENLKAGTYFYHCHVDVAHHMDLGMYGSFIVEEVNPDFPYDREFVLMLDEWDNCHTHNTTTTADPVAQSDRSTARSEADCGERVFQDQVAQNQAANNPEDPCNNGNQTAPIGGPLGCESDNATVTEQQTTRQWYPVTFPVYDPEYNTYLINGKAFPDTEALPVVEGESIKIRMMNVGEEIHSMHLHGHTMLVTHRDGYQLDYPFKVDTLGIMPGERYDVIVVADNPGFWAFHDHVGLNVMNDHIAPGGMFTCMAYDGFEGRNTFEFESALDCINEGIAILQSRMTHTAN